MKAVFVVRTEKSSARRPGDKDSKWPGSQVHGHCDIVSTAISQTRLAFLPPSFPHVPNSSCPYLVPAITREGNDFGFYRNPAS